MHIPTIKQEKNPVHFITFGIIIMELQWHNKI